MKSIRYALRTAWVITVLFIAVSVVIPHSVMAAALQPSAQSAAATPAAPDPTTTETEAQTQAGWKYNIYSGPNLTSRIVLTFDDCPRTLSAYKKVLIYAREANIGLVLAPTGDCIHQYWRSNGVDIAAMARTYGHYTINHSYSHPDLTKSNNVVREISGNVLTDYGRPPYGAHNAKVDRAYASIGMRIWLWNVDTRDWEGKSGAQVADYAIRNAHAGDTVLMHMQWNGFSQSVISQIHDGLAKRGLELCRPFRGYDNVGPVIQAPRLFLNNPLPC